VKLLIVEDEFELLKEIRDCLVQEEFLVETASDYFHAEEKIDLYEYDIAVVDITLPGGSGLDLIRKLKQKYPETGIIIISARDALDDRLTGLEIGADDYLTKPFHLSELNARIKALNRRVKQQGAMILEFNEIQVPANDRIVLIHGQKLALTKKEYHLLVFFISNKNRLITRESIAEHLWGDDIDLVDNFDFIYTHINNLRKKLNRMGCRNYIQTVYGMGYKWTDTQNY
jgi:DNA-binding response OmpR family regulator